MLIEFPSLRISSLLLITGNYTDGLTRLRLQAHIFLCQETHNSEVQMNELVIYILSAFFNCGHCNLEPVLKKMMFLVKLFIFLISYYFPGVAFCASIVDKYLPLIVFKIISLIVSLNKYTCRTTF